eukprot:gene267-biopygen15117
MISTLPYGSRNLHDPCESVQRGRPAAAHHTCGPPQSSAGRRSCLLLRIKGAARPDERIRCGCTARSRTLPPRVDRKGGQPVLRTPGRRRGRDGGGCARRAGARCRVGTRVCISDQASQSRQTPGRCCESVNCSCGSTVFSGVGAFQRGSVHINGPN